MKPYDPLDYGNLARSVVEALLCGPEVQMPLAEPFEGSGVYALYYRGHFEGYTPLVATEPVPPIYVGKAVPTGARKGRASALPGQELCRRLREHGDSIQQATNLELSDFTCRYLVVVPVWITLAERFLLEHYQPVWNVAIDGFGNHDPGRGRRNMRRPQWDILHPGRTWAQKLTAQQSFEEVLAQFDAFLKHRP